MDYGDSSSKILCEICYISYDVTKQLIECYNCTKKTCIICLETMKDIECPYCFHILAEINFKDNKKIYMELILHNIIKKIPLWDEFKKEYSILIENNKSLIKENNFSEEFLRINMREYYLYNLKLKYPNIIDYLYGCDKENCYGYVIFGVDTCDICESKYCTICYKLLDKKHQCSKEDIETVKIIIEESKPCPKCLTRITKSVGCNDMTCTNCGMGFNYRNLAIQEPNEHYQNKIFGTSADSCNFMNSASKIYNSIFPPKKGKTIYKLNIKQLLFLKELISLESNQNEKTLTKIFKYYIQNRIFSIPKIKKKILKNWCMKTYPITFEILFKDQFSEREETNEFNDYEKSVDVSAVKLFGQKVWDTIETSNELYTIKSIFEHSEIGYDYLFPTFIHYYKRLININMCLEIIKSKPLYTNFMQNVKEIPKWSIFDISPTNRWFLFIIVHILQINQNDLEALEKENNKFKYENCESIKLLQKEIYIILPAFIIDNLQTDLNLFFNINFIQREFLEIVKTVENYKQIEKSEFDHLFPIFGAMEMVFRSTNPYDYSPMFNYFSTFFKMLGRLVVSSIKYTNYIFKQTEDRYSPMLHLTENQIFLIKSEINTSIKNTLVEYLYERKKKIGIEEKKTLLLQDVELHIENDNIELRRLCNEVKKIYLIEKKIIVGGKLISKTYQIPKSITNSTLKETRDFEHRKSKLIYNSHQISVFSEIFLKEEKRYNCLIKSLDKKKMIERLYIEKNRLNHDFSNLNIDNKYFVIYLCQDNYEYFKKINLISQKILLFEKYDGSPSEITFTYPRLKNLKDIYNYYNSTFTDFSYFIICIFHHNITMLSPSLMNEADKYEAKIQILTINTIRNTSYLIP